MDIALERHDRRLALMRLGGMALGADGQAGTHDLAFVKTDEGSWAGPDWVCRRLVRRAGSAEVTLQAAGGGLEWRSRWTWDKTTGVVERRDELLNRGRRPITVRGALARLELPSAQWHIYTQSSTWKRENQGAWMPLHSGRLVCGCVPGKTSEGGTPYLVARREHQTPALAVHLLPMGDWTIQAAAHSTGNDLPFLTIDCGPDSARLRRRLAPGSWMAVAHALYQVLPDGAPESGAPRLHAYLNAHQFSAARPAAPVVYNTWFDNFHILDVAHLRRQRDAARAVGCEIFMVDAGWFGAAGKGSWFELVGDWREKTGAAFDGRMRAFADETRSAGMGFGAWMEPERVAPTAPVRVRHPGWFVSKEGYARMRLEQAAPRAWLRGEIGRVIETYGLAWIKLDVNFCLGYDDSGAALADYYAVWHDLLDELRRAYPQTFFEDCAGGGLRLDLRALTHADGYFLSDNVNPVSVLRIGQGAWLRLPPGRLGRWVVLRPAGACLPRYGQPLANAASPLVTPRGFGGWDSVESMDMDFAVLAAMPGMMGFSGDLAGLAPEAIVALRGWTAFYKQWRRFITRSAARLLTPVKSMDERSGWIAVQLSDSRQTRSLLFVYRMGSAGAAPVLQLRDLRPAMAYTVRPANAATNERRRMSGAALMNEGLIVPMTARLKRAPYGAEVFTVREAS